MIQKKVWKTWLLATVALMGISSRALASGTIVTDAPDPHLTVDQAIFFAIHHHPRLFAYRHRVAAKKAKIGEANAHFLPNVGAGALFGTGNPGVSNRPYNNGYAYSPFMPITYGGIGPLGRDGTQTSNVFDASIGATQMLFDFGRYLHVTRSAEKKEHAAVADLVTRDAWVILQVREAYAHLQLDKQLVIVYRKNRNQRALVRELTRSLYKAEYKSKLDDEFAQVDLLKADALLAGMRNDVKTRVARLNEALGLGEGGARNYFPTRVSEDLSPLSPLQDLVKTALDARPEMHAVKSTVGAINEYTSSVKASHYPYLSAFGSFGTLNQLNTGASYTPGWWMGGAMVNVPIYTGGMIRSQVEASHQQALFEAEKLKDLDHRIRYEVVSAHERVRTDLYYVKAYGKAVEEAKLGLRFAQAKYEANLISIVKLTLAEVYLLDTRASLAKAQYRLTVDRAALDFATGQDYPRWVRADGTPRTTPKS